MKVKLATRALMLAGGLALGACAGESTAPSPGPASPALAASESNTWLVRRSVPYDWTGMVTAVVPNAAGESILYGIGGANPDRLCLGRVKAYDVATDTWRSKTDLPAALCGINGAGVINGKIYVAGGDPSNHAKGPVASLYVYDPATNAWSRKADMPEGGSGGITGVIQGRLYVVTVTRTGPKFFGYTPATDNWRRLQSTDYWWLGGGGGVIDGKFYLIAQALKVYDPGTDQWTTTGPLPGDLHGASVVLRGRLHIFGADTRTGRENWGIFIYDPVSNAWTTKPLLATLHDSYNITGASKVFVNEEPRVEVVGGARPGNNLQYIP